MLSETTKSLRIVLGVTGGVAAYKAVELLRRLMDEGFFVSPVLTRDATRFVGDVTFSALASEPTRISLYGDSRTPIPHTYLGQHADAIVIAPATAHCIARLAMGLADDLLTATVLASRAPVLICPAMHAEMWEQPSVQENLATLRRRGMIVMEPGEGHLAGGDAGVGRLPEIGEIVELTLAIVRGHRGPLTGRNVLISAGGTREEIDPVRVVTNNSSGHQGYALAEIAARWGAQVTLVSSVSRSLALDVRRGVEIVNVDSTQSMFRALQTRVEAADVVIMAAAVADFTFERSPEKLKKEHGVPHLVAISTVDIISSLTGQRRPGQVFVAFAAETSDVVENARAKRQRKGVDLIVANDVSAPGRGFIHPTNEVVIISADDPDEVVSLRSKEEVSQAILTRVVTELSRGDR